MTVQNEVKIYADYGRTAEALRQIADMIDQRGEDNIDGSMWETEFYDVEINEY